MTSDSARVKSALGLQSPAPRPPPSRLPPDVAGYIICNDSYPEPVPGEKALEALRQHGARVRTPLKNRSVL